jgi:hypothetical protein
VEVIVTARYPVIPHQPERHGQALVDAHFAERRAQRREHDGGRQLVRDARGSEDITITAAGSATVYHQLGREPRGWRVARSTAAIDEPLYDSGATSSTITIENPGAADFAGRLEVW